MTDTLAIPRSWTFETDEVAAGFDRHVREQLPWYDLASDAAACLVRHYLGRGGLVYDLGASTGNMGRRLAAVVGDRSARFVAIDRSPAMSAVYGGPGKLIVADVLDVKLEPFDVAILFLTLQFLDVVARRELVARLDRLTRPGGAVVVVDKFAPCAGYAGTAISRLTTAGKVAAGVPASDIVAKELSLAGVQRPLTRGELPPRARRWMQWSDFRGYLIEGRR